MSLCPESAERAALTDDEFWERVQRRPETVYDATDEPKIDPEVSSGPCPECGETGACAWDSEGRPLIHATNHDESED